MVTNTVAPDALGGLDRYVRELSAALVRQGVDVNVLTKRLDPRLAAAEQADDGVRLLRFSLPARSKPLYVLRYATAPWPAVAQALRSVRPDVVHAHFAVQALPLALGRRYLYTFHAPAYKEVLDERAFRLPGPLHRPTVALVRTMERIAAARASRVITLSRFMQRELALLSARAAARSRILPGGIDLARFAPGPVVGNPLAERAAPLLFTARRLVPGKGLPELVRAVPEVLNALPEARVVIAGEGILRDALERQIADAGLRRSVRLLGRIDDAALVAWYRRADLVIVPTQTHEGFGLTTAEALACGTPAVGTPFGATPEILGRLDASLIARDGSSGALAACITGVTSQPAHLAALAHRARGTVAPDFGWDAVARIHLDEYEALASASAQTARPI